MTKITIENQFAHTIKSTYKKAGEDWLARLPALIKQCAQQWHLADLQPLKNLTYNYVLVGKQHDADVVLKLRCDPTELKHETYALMAFQNFGGVKLLDHDEKGGALLLLRVQPGNTLMGNFPHNDAESTRIAAKLLSRLHGASIELNHQFPSLRTVLPDLSKDFPELSPFMPQARALKTQLLAKEHSPVLLHGDFHDGNILYAGRDDWVAIDPAGIIGDPLYDVAVYIRNPLKILMEQADAALIVERRIREFSKVLNCSPQRLFDWTYLQTLCSAYWSLEDGLNAHLHCSFLHMLKHINGFSGLHPSRH